MSLCFRCGLYKRGLMHDLSKFGKTEFCESAKYFSGERSPIDNMKEANGYSIAWQHHKGHNPHHWEYWIDHIGSYRNTPIKIPKEYVVEMLCDWVGAGIVYSGNNPDFNLPYAEPKAHYDSHTKVRIFHPDTKADIEYFLDIITNEGINSFCKAAKEYMRDDRS